MALIVPIACRVTLIWLGFASGVLIAASNAHIASGSVVSLQVCVFIGTLAGALLGWRFGAERRRGHQARLAWGHVRRAFTRTDGRSVLSHWPLVHARSHADPAFHARAVLPALLGMPVGIAFGAVVSILALSVLVLLLVELARALVALVPIAVIWLRSTPLPTAILIRLVGLRTLVWFVVWLGFTLLLLIGGGFPLDYASICGVTIMLTLFAGCLWRWPRLAST